jgi:hypothetical protein
MLSITSSSSFFLQFGYKFTIFPSIKQQMKKKFPHPANICPKFGLNFCRGGKNVPWIRLEVLQGWQNRPRVQDIRMQGLQNLA